MNMMVVNLKLLQLAAIKGDTICMATTSKAIYLNACSFGEEVPRESQTFNTEDTNSNLEWRNTFLIIGLLDLDRIFSRVRLYKKGSLNQSLYTWSIEYGSPSEI